MRAPGSFVGGEWRDGGGEELLSLDPFSGEPVWRGGTATEEEVGRAVASCRAAQGAWAALPFERRAERVEAFAGAVRGQRDELADLISRETGKPLWEALTEADAVAGKIPLSLAAYRERCGGERVDVSGGAGEARCRPLGTVAVLGPFNLPAHLPNGQVVPALLAGNAVVFKGSELTPAVAQRTAELWEASGLPPGVLNLVQGGAAVGRALAAHSGLDGLFFTGSYATGRALHRALAGRPEVLLALELGGNNPLVVWDAGDLDAAALQTVQSAYVTAGQRCTCARRLVVPAGPGGEAFLERLVSWIGRIRVGAYTERPEPFLGPVITPEAAARLLAAQQDLLDRGAVPLRVMERSGPAGTLLSPGLLDATGVAGRADEELFGPLLQVVRAGTFDEALEEANRTSYGLSAGLLSDDPDLWRRFAAGARAGVLHWNRSTTGASGRLPFGGLGRSGNHRPGGYRAADFCSDAVALVEGGALRSPPGLPPGDRAVSAGWAEGAVEVNFDGLVGPTHHYAGLSYGNTASMTHGGSPSDPRAAALEGLRKMKLLADLGVLQAVLPPQERPDVAALRRLGFSGTDALVLERAAAEEPELLAACSSASSMWAANAATVSPSADAADGRVHLTPANLRCQLHRSLEAGPTTRALRAVFPDPARFVVHDPLPSADLLGDEGAANHLRLAPGHGAPGLEVFVHGRSGSGRDGPAAFPARQTLEASRAVARGHGLDPARTIFLRQNPAVVDAGAFHADVVAVANEGVLLCHEGAFAEAGALDEVRRRYSGLAGSEAVVLAVPEARLSAAEAVETYLFNSQLVTLPSGGMTLLAPAECREHPRARDVLDELVAGDNPIRSVRYAEVRQSMRNGGGPACLRLRVVLTPEELEAVHPGVLLTSELYGALTGWVERHYRDRLEPADLADPRLLDESRAALDELTRLLALGPLYPFQGG